METITVETKDGVTLLTLNRPKVLNAINPQLIEEVRGAVRQVAADPAIRALVITGTGRGFCAGADLAAPSTAPADLTTGQRVAHSLDTGYNPMARELAALEKPVIAAVNGITAGGGVGLALCADIVIAGRSASFKQVFGPQLALIPDVGSTWFLPRLVGRARARALTLTGDTLPAETAAEWGLIWKCVDDDALMDETMSLAAKLANGPTSAFTAIAKALDHAEDVDFATQLDYERDVQGELADRPNFAEGVTAFLSKRPPKFSAD